MANIVIALYRISKDPKIPNSMPPYYEGLLNALKAYGNNILCFIHDIHSLQWDNREVPTNVIKKIEDFQPDVFILFNYDFYDISDVYNVPIIIYDVDSPNRYHNKTAIQKKPSRYKFAVIQKSGIELVRNFCNDINNEQIKYIKPFTELHNRSEVFRYNIGFCGSHWLWSGCSNIYDFMKMQPSHKEREMAKEVLKQYKLHPFGNLDDIYEQYGYRPDRRIKNEQFILAGRLSGLKRAEYLSYISDLGLEIRGEYWNHPSLNYFPDLALCYDPTPTVTIFENEEFYNSSKIGFNINHIQATTGFSWRVCDILASNACLISEYTSDLKDTFSFLGIPMYKSKEEARECCIKMLENEPRRTDIVHASNEWIEKHYRFKNILPDLEDLCGINMKEECVGKLEIINMTPYFQKKSVQNQNLPIIKRVQRKIWYLLNNKLKREGII